MKVTIVDHQPHWKAQFAEEAERIHSLLEDLDPVVLHIGSTSVPGLCAKPIIDIQIVVKTTADLDRTIAPMQQGYTYLKVYTPEWPTRRLYCKYISEAGATIPKAIDVGDPSSSKQGLRSLCNIHTFVEGSDDQLRHVAFRDYLTSHPEDRDTYCRLKKELAKLEFEDMLAYNNAKDHLVKEVEKKALAWYDKGRLTEF